MRFLQVGGCVRDALLKRTVHDRDWLVLEGSPEKMLAQGFRPVGKDFPVFLHPDTHEEYALARTERKSGKGHGGFTFYCSPDVRVEDDLIRRDLTINAMAMETLADGSNHLVDPYGGQRDLQDKILRHVSGAFAEDPLRVFRVARFAARFHDFTLAKETLALMISMSHSGELNSLPIERVWTELQRGLTEPAPRRMLEVLDACGALSVFLPELTALHDIPQDPTWHPEKDVWEHLLLVTDAVAKRTRDPLTRFSAIVHDLGKATTDLTDLPSHPQHAERGARLAQMLTERLRAPKDYQIMAILSARWHDSLFTLSDHPNNINLWWDLFQGIDLWRRPDHWAMLIDVVASDYQGRPGFAEKEFPFLNFANHVAKNARQPLPKEDRPHDAISREKIYKNRIQTAVNNFQATH